MSPPTRDDLRRLIRSIESRPPRPHVGRPAPRLRVEDTLPGHWERADGSLYLRHAQLPWDYEHGDQRLGALEGVSDRLLTTLAGSEEVVGASLADLLFLDIETTGLGGAGAIAFLVTTGYATQGAFQFRQYLAGSPVDEAMLLRRLTNDVCASHAHPVLVTYNGRTFDAPMLDQRATMHRLRGSFQALPHLDLLPTVRRGFRGVLPSCRLAVVEDHILGVTRPPHEVSGSDVPTWYFRFLRTGDARHLIPLITHNADDVLSLAALLARLHMLASGTRGNGVEHLAMGRLLAAGGDTVGALHHLEVARGALGPSFARDECLNTLATLLRREGRPAEAAALWREIAARPGAHSARAFIELAKHLEHRARDLDAALACVEEAIRAAGATEALLRRRKRLLRKLPRAAVA